MSFLFVTFLFSILALINAYKILLPKPGDKWEPGLHDVTWEVEEGHGPSKVNVYLYNPIDNPPFYLLLAVGVSLSDGKASVAIPYNVVPGSGYTVLLTSENPYNVYTSSDTFDIVEKDGVGGACINYLEDDGSNTIGPIPGDTKTATMGPISPPSVPTQIPVPTSPVPTPPVPTPPEGEVEDCEDCDECEECGECEPGEGCDCGIEDDDHEHDEHDHNKLANVGSTNIVARFWLAMMVTVFSILFL